MKDIYRLKTGTFIAIAESYVLTFLCKILQRFKNHYPSDNTIHLSNNPPQVFSLFNVCCTCSASTYLWERLCVKAALGSSGFVEFRGQSQSLFTNWLANFEINFLNFATSLQTSTKLKSKIGL